MMRSPNNNCQVTFDAQHNDALSHTANKMAREAHNHITVVNNYYSLHGNCKTNVSVAIYNSPLHLDK